MGKSNKSNTYLLEIAERKANEEKETFFSHGNNIQRKEEKCTWNFLESKFSSQPTCIPLLAQ